MHVLAPTLALLLLGLLGLLELPNFVLGQAVIVKHDPIPLDLYFVLDQSGSIATYDRSCMIAQHMSCFAIAVNFVAQLVRAVAPLVGGVSADALRVGLCAFSCTHKGPVTRMMNGLQPIDNELLLNQSLAFMSTIQPNGGTCPSQALDTILSNVVSEPVTVPPRRTAVFIITDGLINNVDTTRAITAATNLRTAGAMFFACAIGDLTSAADRDKQHSELLAETGNANFIFKVANEESLSKILVILSALTLNAFEANVTNTGCFMDSIVLTGPTIQALASDPAHNQLSCMFHDPGDDAAFSITVPATFNPVDGSQSCALPVGPAAPVVFSDGLAQRETRASLVVNNLTLSLTLFVQAPLSDDCFPQPLIMDCSGSVALPSYVSDVATSSDDPGAGVTCNFTMTGYSLANGTLAITERSFASQGNVSWCPGPLAVPGYAYALDVAVETNTLVRNWPVVVDDDAACPSFSNALVAHFQPRCYGAASLVSFTGTPWPGALCVGVVAGKLVALGPAASCSVPYGVTLDALVVANSAGDVELVLSTPAAPALSTGPECGSATLPAQRCLGVPYALSFSGAAIDAGAMAGASVSCEFLIDGAWTASALSSNACTAPSQGETQVRIVKAGVVTFQAALPAAPVCAALTSSSASACWGGNVTLSFAGFSLASDGFYCSLKSAAAGGAPVWVGWLEAGALCVAPSALMDDNWTSLTVELGWAGTGTVATWTLPLAVNGDACVVAGALGNAECFGADTAVVVGPRVGVRMGNLLGGDCLCMFSNALAASASVAVNASGACAVPWDRLAPSNWSLKCGDAVVLAPRALPFDYTLCFTAYEARGLCPGEIASVGFTLAPVASTNASRFACEFSGALAPLTSVPALPLRSVASAGAPLQLSCNSSRAWTLPESPFETLSVLVDGAPVWTSELAPVQPCWQSEGARCMDNSTVARFSGPTVASAQCSWDSHAVVTKPIVAADGSTWCVAPGLFSTCALESGVALATVQLVSLEAGAYAKPTWCLNMTVLECAPDAWVFGGLASALLPGTYNTTLPKVAGVTLDAGLSPCLVVLGGTQPPLSGDGGSGATVALAGGLAGVAVVGFAFASAVVVRRRRQRPQARNAACDGDALMREAEAEAARIVAWVDKARPPPPPPPPVQQYTLSASVAGWLTLPFALFQVRSKPSREDDDVVVAPTADI